MGDESTEQVNLIHHSPFTIFMQGIAVVAFLVPLDFTPYICYILFRR